MKIDNVRFFVGTSYFGHFALIKFCEGDKVKRRTRMFFRKTREDVEKLLLSFQKEFIQHELDLKHESSLTNKLAREIKLKEEKSLEELQNLVKSILSNEYYFDIEEDYDPLIIKFSEKHGENYYVVKNKKEFNKVFFEVLKTRFNDYWFSWMKDFENTKEFVSQETIDLIPDTPELKQTKEGLQKKLYDWMHQERICKGHQELYLEIKQVIEYNQIEKAYEILDELKEGEYEGYEVITPNKTNDL